MRDNKLPTNVVLERIFNVQRIEIFFLLFHL
jgi:hypothetical protein